MTPDRFNTIVQNRAKERVEKKIADFEKAVADAALKLHPSLKSNYLNRWSGGSAGKAMAAIFRRLLSREPTPEHPTGYPAELWADEEKAVQEELLATMDEMAKALACQPPAYSSPVAFGESTTVQTEVGKEGEA